MLPVPGWACGAVLGKIESCGQVEEFLPRCLLSNDTGRHSARTDNWCCPPALSRVTLFGDFYRSVTQFGRLPGLANLPPLQVSGSVSLSSFEIIASVLELMPLALYLANIESVITSKYETSLQPVGVFTPTAMSDVLRVPTWVPSNCPALTESPTVTRPFVRT